MNKSNTNFRLTKAGVTILVLTLVFSTLFFISGAVNLASSGDNSSGDNGGEQNYVPTHWAYENTSTYFSAQSGRTYTIKITPDRGGRFTLKIDGAYITEITDDLGNSVSYSSSNSYYDYTYTAYLYSSNTYTITIYAISSNVTFLAEH